MLDESIFDFRYVRLYDVDIPKEKWLTIYKQSLHCLPLTLLRSPVLNGLIHLVDGENFLWSPVCFPDTLLKSELVWKVRIWFHLEQIISFKSSPFSE